MNFVGSTSKKILRAIIHLVLWGIAFGSFFLIVLLPFSIEINFIMMGLVFSLTISILHVYFPDRKFVNETKKERAVFIMIFIPLLWMIFFAIYSLFGVTLGKIIGIALYAILLSYGIRLKNERNLNVSSMSKTIKI
jgi:hypothetical protein